MQEKVNDYNDLSDETRAEYSRRSLQFVRRWRKQIWLAGDSDLDEPSLFVRWLTDLRPGLKPSAWRQYKAALTYIMSQEPEWLWPFSDPKMTQRAAAALLDVDQGPCLKKSGKTSSLKRKSIGETEHEQLIKYFTEQSSLLSIPILNFLFFNRFVGLRPIECANCCVKWDANTATLKLIVENAKYDKERAHGPTRTILFKYPTADLVNSCLSFFNFVETQVTGTDSEIRRKQWETVLKPMRDAIAYASRSVWPRRKQHITLYSTRHCAAAFFKESWSSTEVAALLGHAADDTASKHYARPSKHSKSRGPDTPIENLPKASSEEVTRVRKKERRLPPARAKVSGPRL